MTVQGHYAESGLLSADTLVKAAPGRVRSITIAYKGVTAGEFCTLRDSLTNVGDNEVVFVFPAANGTIVKEWPEEGKRFDTGIYYNKGATAGQVWTEITYK